MAHPRHEQVRQRYDARCGYCGVSESDCGGALTVDHFLPTSKGGDEGDDNLVYSCFKCNQYKGGFSPTAEDLAAGRRVLHPKLDDLRQHYSEREATCRLEAITSTGEFHIALLQLNRPALVQFRLQQSIAVSQSHQHQLLEDEVAMLASTITGLEVQLARLERLLEQRQDKEPPE